MALSSADPLMWVRQNPRIPVEFQGWRSDTQLLGRYGWRMALHEDPMRGTAAVVFDHCSLGLMCEGIVPNFHRLRGSMECWNDGQIPAIQIRGFRSRESFMIHTVGRSPYLDMKFVETEPRMTEIDEKTFRLCDIPLFAEVGASEAKELIVDPEDVQMVLDKILAAQAPGMRDIRARDRKRDANEEKTYHAQIISIKAA